MSALLITGLPEQCSNRRLEQCSDRRLPLFEELGHSCRNCDEEAFVIAEFLPQLRFLRLVECTLTDSGLQVVLDGCPQLEYIVLRNFFNINLGGNLLKRCVLRKSSCSQIPEDKPKE
ncbi:hypothetical protein IFM89_027772 [Coptis chinensis]|uniref:Uncharacterized protein n=1 Tax=Coptis chinensis TaxID=261450 RepID=A0A835I6W1_9MAGN|nr:hypothetical protein IFM89_027772 [Coptis chinensis]